MATGIVGGDLEAVPWHMKHIWSVRRAWSTGRGLEAWPAWQAEQGFLEAMFGGMGGGPPGVGAWQVTQPSLLFQAWLTGTGHMTSRLWQARQSSLPFTRCGMPGAPSTGLVAASGFAGSVFAGAVGVAEAAPDLAATGRELVLSPASLERGLSPQAASNAMAARKIKTSVAPHRVVRGKSGCLRSISDGFTGCLLLQSKAQPDSRAPAVPCKRG